MVSVNRIVKKSRFTLPEYSFYFLNLSYFVFFFKNFFLNLSSHLILPFYSFYVSSFSPHTIFYVSSSSLNILVFLGCRVFNDLRGTRRAFAICDFLSSSALKGVWAAQSSHLCAGHISAHLRYIHKSAHLLSLLLDLSPFVYVNLPLSLSTILSLSTYLIPSLAIYLSIYI